MLLTAAHTRLLRHQKVLRMIPDDGAYKDSTNIDLDDPKMVAYRAMQWGVSPLTIVSAVKKVGPLVRNIAVEVWKIV